MFLVSGPMLGDIKVKKKDNLDNFTEDTYLENLTL